MLLGERPPTCHHTPTSLTGHEITAIYDGISYWSCPLCGAAWHRWPVGHPRRGVVAETVAGWDQS